MVNSYKLVNPYIRGEFETKIKTKNSVDAARKFYNALSEHFNNSVPKFYFTIQKGGGKNGKFYHFEVSEKRNNDEVDFSIKPMNLDNQEQVDELFVENFKSFKGRFNGGGKKRGSKRGSRKGSRKSSRKSSRRSSRRSSRKSSRKSEVSGKFGDDFDEDYFYRNALEFVPVASQPISYLYYDPFVYNLESVFFPTFYAYLSPYVELNTRTGLTMTQVSIN